MEKSTQFEKDKVDANRRGLKSMPVKFFIYQLGILFLAAGPLGFWGGQIEAL